MVSGVLSRDSVLRSSQRAWLLACVGTSWNAWADDLPNTPSPTPDVPAAEITVVARRVPTWQHESDRTEWLISREQIDRRQPRSTPEILHDVPGVSVQMTNRGAGAPILRGLVGPQNLILIDGIRLNNSTWRTGPLQYLALIDPWSIERMEVQLGPGSVLYGSDAMGGIVQAIPRAIPTQ
jgi:hemoglobin/transferrin/lactoferrin receptor protein